MKFDSEEELKKHEKTHENDREKHQMTNTGTVLKQYGCNGYDKKFTKLDELKIHEKIHSKIFTCKQCNIEFTKLSGLEKHKKTNHKQFGCRECDNVFKSKTDLERHENTQTDAMQFTCNLEKSLGLRKSSRDMKILIKIESHSAARNVTRPLQN